MIHTGYLTWIILFSWGITVVSVLTLSHVKKYQTVTPGRLKDSSGRNHAATHQKYPDTRQNLTLHLERNIHFIGKNLSVTHHSDEGNEVTTNPDLGVHCYYHGHIVGVEASSASVRLCSGIKGFVLLRGQTYIIEHQGDTQSSNAHSDEGLHVVYNYKHLRRKRSSRSPGAKTTFFDHGAHPSGQLQRRSLESTAHAEDSGSAVQPRTVELVLVADNTLFKRFNESVVVERRLIQIANNVDRLYRPLGIRVMLVGLYIWSFRDKMVVSTTSQGTLKNFLQWRENVLLPRIEHDNAQLITGVDFKGETLGLAYTSTMCTLRSGGINQDTKDNLMGVSVTIAHEMGHNLGMNHDKETCMCGLTRDCIMATTVGNVYPSLFSNCSQMALKNFLKIYNPICMLNVPSTTRIRGGPVCGNAFVEAEEECDCGTKKECKNHCCDAKTCKRKALAQCADGECCENCQLKSKSNVCRPKATECDVEEYCTGLSASCPTDAYVQNGLLCNSGKGYCYKGQCPSKQQQCKVLWGPDAVVAPKACFSKHGKCRQTMFGRKCRRSSREQSCVTLFCSGGRKFPVTSGKSMYTLTSGQKCNEATLKPNSLYSDDMVKVPTGTKCGINRVCYERLCQDIPTLKAYESRDCSHNCNNNGVCDYESECNCDPGWLPPFCQERQKEKRKVNKKVIIAAGAVGMVLIIGILSCCCCCCCCRRGQPQKRRSSKRRSTARRVTPGFPSSGSQGSTLPFRNQVIEQPTFKELSHTGYRSDQRPAPAQAHSVPVTMRPPF